MTSPSPNGRSGADSAPFARALLEVAAEVEAAELQIKQEVLGAARAGDCARIVEIVEALLTEPPVEVLSKTLPSSGSRRYGVRRGRFSRSVGRILRG
jgi:hypothetical protein